MVPDSFLTRDGRNVIPREPAETNPGKVADVLLSFGDATITIGFTACGAVSKVAPDSAGVHPDWRRAVGLAFIWEGWTEGDPVTVIRDAKTRLIADIDKLATLGSATYFNEASLYEKDFKAVFFGRHYSKLKKIKNNYDPRGLFVVASGVGSDDWEVAGECLLTLQ